MQAAGVRDLSGFRPVLKELAYAETNTGINQRFISIHVLLRRLSYSDHTSQIHQLSLELNKAIVTYKQC